MLSGMILSVKHRIAILCLARTLSTGIETGERTSFSARLISREPYPRGLKQVRGPSAYLCRYIRREPYPRGLKQAYASPFGDILHARTLSTGIETGRKLINMDAIILREPYPRGLKPMCRSRLQMLAKAREPYPRGLKQTNKRFPEIELKREPYPRGLKPHARGSVGGAENSSREPYPRGLKPAQASPRGIRLLRANLIHGD